MKTINSIILFALSLITFTSCGDDDLKVRTFINEDGTCTREISYQSIMSQSERDSLWGKGNTGYALPVPESVCIDGMKNTKTEIKGDTVISTFSQEFASVEEMHKSTPIRLNGKVLESDVTFKKEFKLFFTEYHYTEKFHNLKNLLPVSPDKIGGVDTVSYWFTGKPDIMIDDYGYPLSGSKVAERIKDIEPMVTRWLEDNYIELLFSTIEENYDSIKNAPLTKEEFISTCDSLAEKIHIENFVTDEELIQAFHDFYKSDAYDIFMDGKSKYSEIFLDKINIIDRILNMEIPYSIKMPGCVCGGNNICVDNNQDGIGLFKIDGEKLIGGDFCISQSTRVINTWVFVVAGLIIIIAIGSFIYGRKKK